MQPYRTVGYQTPYQPVDPFKPSIAFSWKNLFSSRHDEPTIDGIPVRPRPAVQRSRVRPSSWSPMRRERYVPSRPLRTPPPPHRAAPRAYRTAPLAHRAAPPPLPDSDVESAVSEDDLSAEIPMPEASAASLSSGHPSSRSFRSRSRSRNRSSRSRTSRTPPPVIMAPLPQQVLPPNFDIYPPPQAPARSHRRSPSASTGHRTQPVAPIVIQHPAPTVIQAPAPTVIQAPAQSEPRIYPLPDMSKFPDRRASQPMSFPAKESPISPPSEVELSASSLEYVSVPAKMLPSGPTLRAYIFAFAVDTLPRQIYLYLLLRIPYLYFSRVTRIFEEAELSMPQIKECVMEAATATKTPQDVALAFGHNPLVKSPSFENLQNTWQSFVESLMREWKTLNIISVLLLSAILTILQIDSAANDPLTRFSALLSMICALMSLVYGCIYIIRFGAMRKAHKAAEWANEAQKNKTGIIWNVWVLLAMPATWLAWSMIMYIVCIMSFVWRTGTIDDAERGPPTRREVLVPRIVITVVLFFGVTYFVLIANTLRRYGEVMDRAWQRRIAQWLDDVVPKPFSPVPSSGIAPLPSNYIPLRPSTSLISLPPSHVFDERPPKRISPARAPTTLMRSMSVVDLASETGDSDSEIKMTRLLSLPSDIQPMEALNDESSTDEGLTTIQMPVEKQKPFVSAMRDAWDSTHLDRIFPSLADWNEQFFNARDGQVVLCAEFDSTNARKHAIYHVSKKGELPSAPHRYQPVLGSLKRLDILPAYGGTERQHIYITLAPPDYDASFVEDEDGPGWRYYYSDPKEEHVTGQLRRDTPCIQTQSGPPQTSEGPVASFVRGKASRSVGDTSSLSS